jgi:hypothetical protein
MDLAFKTFATSKHEFKAKNLFFKSTLEEPIGCHTTSTTGGHWQKFRKPRVRKYRVDFIQDT